MKTTFFLILFFFFSTLSAEEFWIQPSKFKVKRGETINLRFLFGENFEGENWSGDRSKVKEMHFYYGGVSDKKLVENLSNKSGDSLQLAMIDEGTAMVTMVTENNYIELDSADFDAYLLTQGLEKIIEQRRKQNDTSNIQRENYQRSAKTILQVGSKHDNSYKLKTGIPVDIILEEHPHTRVSEQGVDAQIFYKNQPLQNAKVFVWHYVNGKTTRNEYRTNDKGKFEFFMAPNGRWMISTVQIERLNNDPAAKWQSYWGTLTWGYY